MKLLCTADIHIGRRASRVPAAYDDSQRFSASAAWSDVVQLAIDKAVDLLLLAGDVVDQDNRYFEAYGPLEEGLTQLKADGIQTVAVAGNHDIDVLPRLADTIGNDALRLLGRDGKWERFTVEREGQRLHIDGWSFPRRQVHRSPLEEYHLQREDGVPHIGLLHGDLDQTDSSYAPVATRHLEEAPCDFWLLGHVHRPHALMLDNGACVLYPGSPLALDPGEPGEHGPWFLTVEGSTLSDPEQWPLSRVRYEQFAISLDGIHDAATFQPHVVRCLQDDLDTRVDETEALELICARLTLTGRTRLYSQMSGLAFQLAELTLLHQGTTVVVEKAENQTRPDIDLNTLAQEPSPLGVLAQLLLEMESGEVSAETRQLCNQLTRQLASVHSANTYTPIADDMAPDEEMSLAYLRRAGYALLDALSAQKEAA